MTSQPFRGPATPRAESSQRCQVQVTVESCPLSLHTPRSRLSSTSTLFLSHFWIPFPFPLESCCFICWRFGFWIFVLLFHLLVLWVLSTSKVSSSLRESFKNEQHCHFAHKYLFPWFWKVFCLYCSLVLHYFSTLVQYLFVHCFFTRFLTTCWKPFSSLPVPGASTCAPKWTPLVH